MPNLAELALNVIHQRRKPKRTAESLPVGLLSSILNQPTVSRARTRFGEGYTLHVSDIIRSEADSKFCPRACVLEDIGGASAHSKIITPGRELMFETAHMFHSHVAKSIVKRSKWRNYMWGQWTCRCGKTVHTGYADFANVCKACRKPVAYYEEYSFYWPRYRLVGHPDILFLVGKGRRKVLYIYEIKTVDRRDVNLFTLTAPLGAHLIQASFYYHMARAEGFVVHPRIRFLYIDRSSRGIFENLPYKELEARPYDLNMLEQYFQAADAVAMGIQTLKLPKRICEDAFCARARGCHMRTSCFSRRLPYAESKTQASRRAA